MWSGSTRKVKELITAQEDILYIAVQKRPLVNLAPDSVVVTNRRLIIYRPKLLGQVDMEDFGWPFLFDARVKEGITGATLSFRLSNGAHCAIDYLPKAQARCLYRFAQEMEEKMAVYRRQLELENRRASAGGGGRRQRGASARPTNHAGSPRRLRRQAAEAEADA